MNNTLARTDLSDFKLIVSASEKILNNIIVGGVKLNRKLITDRRPQLLHDTLHTLIDKDHLGDWSPEKDCC